MTAQSQAHEEFDDYQYPEFSDVESPEREDSPEPEPHYNERPLGLQALPRLEDVPPGVLYVCDAEPNARLCHLCMEDGRCSVYKWNHYKTLPDVAIGLFRPHRYTLTGFVQPINLVVIGYLGRFCSSTHVA